MNESNTVSTLLASGNPVQVKAGDKLELMGGGTATVTRINPTITGGWVFEAKLGDDHYQWNTAGHCLGYERYYAMCINKVIPSEEKLPEFTHKLKYHIDTKAPDLNHLRVIRRDGLNESHVDLATGCVVRLKNGNLSVIKAISDHNEEAIYGYSPNTHVQPVWDYNLNYITGGDQYEIVEAIGDAYFIFSNNIGLVTVGSVVKLQNGKEALITGIGYEFPNTVTIYGRTTSGNFSLKWNHRGKNRSYITPVADIESVVTCNFRNTYPTFENFQSTSASQDNKESEMNESTSTIEAVALLNPIPVDQLNIQLGSQVKLTNGKVAFVGRVPNTVGNPYRYYFVELPGGRERILDIRPEHQDDNKIGVAEVLCGPERLTEYYFDFRNIKEGDSYSYISNGEVITKPYSGDDIDVLNQANPFVFDTRFLAVWRLSQMDKAMMIKEDVEEQADTPKYEILPEEVSGPDGGGYCQIRALRDIPEIGVEKGDLGGFVGSQTSLSHSGNSWVFEGGYIGHNAIVEGDAIVGEGTTVTGTAHVKDTAAICRGVVVDGDAVIGGGVIIHGGNISKGAVVTQQNHYLHIDNANGRGTPCTIYNTEGGMVGASVAGHSSPNWRDLSLNPNVSTIMSRDVLKAHVYTYAMISRR